MSSFEEDFRWQERFRRHYSEIALLATRFEVAAPEDDWKRNTDFVLTMRQNRLTFSARARRLKYAGRYRDNFTIRLRRGSGAQTEMDKMLRGHGDMLIYGFESAEGSDRLGPWMLCNLAMLRDYIADGGFYRSIENRDRRSVMAVFNLQDMPLGFVLNSDGLPAVDRDDPWQRCRNPTCEGRWVPGFRGEGRFVVPLGDDLRPGPGKWRQCMYCGTRWRSGWVAPMTREDA